MRFQHKYLLRWLLVTGLVAAVSCAGKGRKAPSREEIEGLLQQEAESLKRDGEKVDPSLGVKITWEIQSVEVREQAANASQPWVGTIRFVIRSEQPEYDGTTATQTFEKQFDYIWDLTSGRWIMN